MIFPNNAWEHAKSVLEICQNENESTFQQNIGNSFSRHQYNTRFTYTSNHKLHIYIKPQAYIYIKPQASQKEENKTSDLWVINGRNEVGGASTYIYMKQSRSNGKYGWINARNEGGEEEETEYI